MALLSRCAQWVASLFLPLGLLREMLLPLIGGSGHWRPPKRLAAASKINHFRWLWV